MCRIKSVLLTLGLALGCAHSKMITMSVTHNVECTSQGISEMEYRKYTKVESRLFNKTLTETGRSIEDALDEAISISTKNAENIQESLATSQSDSFSNAETSQDEHAS